MFFKRNQENINQKAPTNKEALPEETELEKTLIGIYGSLSNARSELGKSLVDLGIDVSEVGPNGIRLGSLSTIDLYKFVKAKEEEIENKEAA